MVLKCRAWMKSGSVIDFKHESEKNNSDEAIKQLFGGNGFLISYFEGTATQILFSQIEALQIKVED